MGFALAWAWSIRFNWVLLNLDDMARFHGSLNALGFGLLGLRSLPDLVPEQADLRDGDEPSVSVHIGRLSAAALDRVAAESASRHVVGPSPLWP